MTEERDQEVVYFNSNIGDDDIDMKFNRLFEQLLNYTKSIIDLMEELCQDEEDMLRLALKVGETDGRLLPRLVEKEVERRRLLKLKAELIQSSDAEKRPIRLQDIISEREIETIQVEEIVEMILETRNAQQMQPISINKSRLEGGGISAVLFSLCSGPEKGFAVFLPEGEHENIGALHIFDEYGIKRKIRSNIKIVDLDVYADTDVFDPYKRTGTPSLDGGDATATSL